MIDGVRHHMVDGVGYHSAGGVVVGTSGGVGGDCHDVGGHPVAGGGGHLGDGVCQLGPGTGAGQDEGKCDKRLHADGKNGREQALIIVFVISSRHKLPSVFVEGPLETGGSGHITIASGQVNFGSQHLRIT